MHISEIELDANKVKDSKQFQRLLNDLVAFETNYLDRIPSSPDIGPDGGWDGVCTADIDFLNLTGQTSIQAKTISLDKTPQQVFESVKKDLLGTASKKGEIQNAIDKGSKNLLLASLGKMTIDQVRELQALKPQGLEKLIILDRENLFSRIKTHPFLVFYYFQNTQYPSLVPGRIYYAKHEKTLIPESQNLSERTDQYVELLKTFLASDSKKVLTVSANGGVGKSHLVRQIALDKSIESRNLKVLMYEDNHRSMDTVIEEEIMSDQKYLVILEDVDRDMSNLEPLLKFVTNSDNVKVILSYRSSSKFIIKDRLISHQLTAFTDQIELAPWSELELRTLFKIINPNVEDAKVNHLVRHYSNPYILTWVAAKLNGEDLQPEELHDKLISQLNTEIENACKAIVPAENVGKLIFIISCLIPFRPSDDAVIEIAEFVQLETTQVNSIIERLLEVDIFRLVGGRVRFSPDLKGDLYLQHHLSSITQSELKEIVRRFGGNYLNNLLMNVNSASYYGESNILNATIEELVSDWIKQCQDSYDMNSFEAIVPLLSYVMRIVPAKVFDLVKVLLQKQHFKTTDSLGPLLIGLYRQPQISVKVFELILLAFGEVREGTYSNYKYEGITRGFFNPMHFSLQQIVGNIDYFSSVELSLPVAHIALFGLKEILSASHEFEENYDMTITLGRRSLKNEPIVTSTRDKAVSLLTKIFNLHILELTPEILEVVDHVGESLEQVGTVEGDLHQVFITEQDSLVKLIDLELVGKLNLSQMILVENFLLEWWSQEKGGADYAGELLTEFPRSMEFLCSKMMTWHSAVVLDFDSFKQYTLSEEAQTKFGRNGARDSTWNWYVNVQFDDSYSGMVLAHIVGELVTDFPKTDALKLLSVVAETLKDRDSSKAPLFIAPWVEQKLDMFLEIRDNHWQSVPVAFRPYIDGAILNSRNEKIEDIIVDFKRDFSSKSYSEKVSLVEMVFLKYLPAQLAFIRWIIDKADNNLLSVILWSNWRYMKNGGDSKVAVEIINKVTKRVEFPDPNFLRNLAWTLEEIKQPNLLVPSIKRRLRKYLVRMNKPDDVFESLCKLVANNLSDLLSIIDDRLKREDSLFRMKYGGHEWTKMFLHTEIKRNIRQLVDDYYQRAVRPFLNDWRAYLFHRDYLKAFDAVDLHGIETIKDYIKNYGDYAQAVDHFISWKIKSSYSIGQILNPLLWLEDENGKYCYLYIEELKSSGKHEELVRFLKLLNVEILGVNYFVEQLEFLYSEGKLKNRDESVAKLIFKKIETGGFSSSMGEVPGVFLDKKQLFESMRDLAVTQWIKNEITRNIEFIDQEIRSHQMRDEELLNER